MNATNVNNSTVQHSPNRNQGHAVKRQTQTNSYATNINAPKVAGERSQSDIDIYLREISRLENQVRKGTIKENEVERILSSLDKRIQSLSEKSRKKIYALEEYKAIKIEDARKMKQALQHALKEKEQQEKVFQLLKNREFISAIRDEPSQPKTYSPMNS